MSRSGVPTWTRLKALIAEPWLLPDRVLAFLLFRACRGRTFRVDSFGWTEAILCSSKIDRWRRYASVVLQIEKLSMQPVSILDVGGGDGIIGEFLDSRKYSLTVFDINIEALRRITNARLQRIVGDGCRLPFEDNSFDVVVSVDSLEHVPGSKKADYCREIKRVAKSCVVMHCPADSSDGEFQATGYDLKFLNWYRHRFGRDEPNTREHLNSGLPKVQDLINLFPGATISGKHNVNMWLKYLTRCYTRYVRFTAGLWYKLRLDKKDSLPPYYACLLVWRKG